MKYLSMSGVLVIGMRAARCAYTSTMRKTPAAHGIHSQTPAAPAVPNRLGSRKKIAVVMLIIEKAMAKEP